VPSEPAVAPRRTRRLTLRPVTADDLDALVTLSIDPRVNLHRPGGPPTRAQARRIVREFISHWERDGLGYWLVERDEQVVGIAGTRPIVLRGRPCWNLYYRFSPTVWGQGVAGEATREAVRAAREHGPQRLVVARTRADNAPAIRLALAIGLTRRPELDADGFVTYAA
jgi:[ribosomal protein S5]-alanine N-acetyltransferase